MLIHDIWNIKNYYFNRKNVYGIAFAGLYDEVEDDLYDIVFDDFLYGDVEGFVQVRHFYGKDIKIHPGKTNISK